MNLKIYVSLKPKLHMGLYIKKSRLKTGSPPLQVLTLEKMLIRTYYNTFVKSNKYK